MAHKEAYMRIDLHNVGGGLSENAAHDEATMEEDAESAPRPWAIPEFDCMENTMAILRPKAKNP